MLRYLVPLLFTLSTVTSYQSIQPYARDATPSAASPAQIRFAQENKYDDTGPGAKKPDFAYSTYKTLEEALVAYLDDPDTKLPEFERAKAVQKLLQTHAYQNSAYYPKTRNFSPRPFHQPQQGLRNPFPSLSSKTYYPTDSHLGFIQRDKPFSEKFEKKPETFKFQKLHTVKGNPISLAHYTRDPDSGKPFEDFNPFPKYTFAYGVHDKSTGDLKQVSESRDAGNVRGFYSFIDANGKQHTVHYTSDDTKGFRAAVGQFPTTT